MGYVGADSRCKRAHRHGMADEPAVGYRRAVAARNGVVAGLAFRVARVGHAMYAAAVAGLGALLLSGKFVYVWAPLPSWVPWRDVLACAFGAVLLVLAVVLLWRKTVVASSATLAFLFLSWLLLVQVPRIIGTPSKEILWSGGGQLASLVAGAWLLFAARASPTERAGR